MDVKQLVIIGVLLIIVSCILYVYVNVADLKDRLYRYNQDAIFTTEAKDNLAEIDNNIVKELAREEEISRLKQELRRLKKEDRRRELNDEIKDLKKADDVKNEVFLVKNNIFDSDIAPKVCSALFNAQQASKAQINDSFNNGANWCNYGWVAERGEAYYPLQADQNDKICVGDKGLNGGQIQDGVKLGVACYGEKPDQNTYSDIKTLYSDTSLAEGDIALLEDYRKRLNNGGIKIAPFNDKQWSRYSYKNDVLKIDDAIVVTGKKDSSNDPNTIKVEKVVVKEYVLPTNNKQT